MTTSAKPCGKCDVCLANKKPVDLSNKEFKTIEQAIYLTIEDKALEPKDLISKLRKSYSKEEILFVIKWMLDNEQLAYTSLNRIKRK